MKHVFPKSLEEEKTYLYPFSLFHKNGGKTGETREARQLFLQTSHKLFHPFGSSFHQMMHTSPTMDSCHGLGVYHINGSMGRDIIQQPCRRVNIQGSADNYKNIGRRGDVDGCPSPNQTIKGRNWLPSAARSPIFTSHSSGRSSRMYLGLSGSRLDVTFVSSPCK